MADQGLLPADEAFISGSGEARPSPWRGLWVSGAALVVTLALVALILLVTASSRARDEALRTERRSSEIVLLTRSIDATIGRAEAALARYVLDEDRRTGTAYYNEWRSALALVGTLERRLSTDPEQRARIQELSRLLSRRNAELAPAVQAAQRGMESGGLSFLYQAGSSPTLPALRATLEGIAGAERATLRRRIAETQGLGARADTFVDWLGGIAVLVALAAVGLAVMAWRAFREGVAARDEAESESLRAMALDHAVQDRTRELREANEMLRLEAHERAAAEAQLRQIQKMEAVGQLTGGIAHDFNNMLAVIVGGLDLAKRRLHGPRREVEFHLDNAMEGATRAAALTRRLLGFARAEPLAEEPVVPAELIENMLEMIDRTIGERITVRTETPETPWLVLTDPAQLENAILNLAVNARDAMEGKGELRIEIANAVLAENEVDDLPAGDHVRISIADTGCGIAPEHIDRVFDPFFTTKPVGKGTGLGLTQIFGFVRQSGGHAKIASVPGEGTRVTLWLPRLDERDLDHPAQRSAPASLETPTSHRNASILLVEDDPRVARSTLAALDELGYRTTGCSGGHEAIALLDDPGGFDLVVTDVMMPEMTGPELAAEIRRQGRDVPILFVTGYAGEANGSGELVGGEVLRKPFTVSALAGAVETVLGRGPS